MVWYSRLFQNFPQFIVIHTVKGFGIVNKAEINVYTVAFLENAEVLKLQAPITRKDLHNVGVCVHRYVHR